MASLPSNFRWSLMSTVVLHVGKREVADLLFIGRLGRFLNASSQFRTNVIVVHDAIDVTESVVENAGLSIDSIDASDWAAIAEDVFRSIRNLNRRIVNSLSEEGVPAIGFLAADRGLVQAGDGELNCSKPEMFDQLTASGTVLVLGPVIQTGSSSMALQSSATVATTIANSLARNRPTGLIHFSESMRENTNIGSRLYNVTTYAKSTETVFEDTVRPEILAEAEFWERFS